MKKVSVDCWCWFPNVFCIVDLFGYIAWLTALCAKNLYWCFIVRQSIVPFQQSPFSFFYTDKEIHRLQGLYLFWYILRLTAICSDKLIISEAGNYNSSFRANIIKNIQLGQLGHLEGGKCAWMWRFDFCCFCCCLMFSKFFFIVLIYPSIMRVCSEQHFLRVYLKFRSPPGPNF